MKELIENNRIIGGCDWESARRAEKIYRHFVDGEIVLTDARTAEMVKLSENIFRDVNIALANELAQICDRLGISVWEVVRLANLHPRVNLHQPGPGVGGHCISVDPWFVISKFPAESRILALARRINNERPAYVVGVVAGLLAEISDPVVTIMGITYKGNIGDTRESPALAILEELRKKGITCRVYDPHVNGFPEECGNLTAAFTGSDCALLLADHDEFKYLYPRELGKVMRNCTVVDTRNFLEPQLWKDSGFEFVLLGSGAYSDK